MKFKNFTKKKAVTFGLAFGVAAGAGGIAAAFFSASGSGTGAADVGTANQALTIREIGASYSSLIPSTTKDPYSTSMCSTACTQPSEIGGNVNFATGTPKYTTDFVHVTSVTVALVNFGTAHKTFPVTLNLFTGPNGSYSFTTKANITAGTSKHQVATDVTFNLAGTNVFLNKTSKYGIHLTTALTGVVRNTNNINIARVQPSIVSVGSNNGGTYTGSGTTPVTTNANFAGWVPAVQFNSVNGVIPPLFPNSPKVPVQYAITNPNTASVHVGTITSTIKTGGATNNTVYGAATCQKSWFNLANSAYPYTSNVPSGTTIITSGSTTLQMTTSHTSQNACEGHSVPLLFSSN